MGSSPALKFECELRCRERCLIGGKLKGYFKANMFEEIRAEKVFIEMAGHANTTYGNKAKSSKIKKNKERQVVFKDRVLLQIVEGEVIGPGESVVPFVIEIPRDLPPSAQFKASQGKDSCEICYYARAIFVRSAGKDGELEECTVAETKLQLETANADAALSLPKQVADVHDLMSCMCCRGGAIGVTVFVERTHYRAGEIMRIKCGLQNGSVVNVQKIHVALQEIVTVRSHGSKRVHRRELCSVQLKGVAAGTSAGSDPFEMPYEVFFKLPPELPLPSMNAPQLTVTHDLVIKALAKGNEPDAAVTRVGITLQSAPMERPKGEEPWLDYSENSFGNNGMAPRRDTATPVVPPTFPLAPPTVGKSRRGRPLGARFGSTVRSMMQQVVGYQKPIITGQ